MEEIYRKLIDALPDIVYQIDVNGQFVYVNDSIRKLGYEPTELIGRHFSSIINSEDSARMNLELVQQTPREDIISEALFFNERRTGKRITKNLKVVLTRKADSEGPVDTVHGEVFATGLHERTPEGLCFIGTLGIIREGADAGNRNMLRLEQYYQVLLEHSFEIIMVVAHDGTILFASNSVRKNIGKKPIDLIGENIIEIVHPDDAFSLRYLMERIVSPKRKNNRLEMRIRHVRNGWRHFDAIVSAVQGHRGDTIMCYVLHASDISERKKIESALEKREQIYKTLLRTSPDAIILFDKEGDIIMVNDRASEIIMASREDLFGRHFLSLVIGSEHDGAHDVLTHIKEQGSVTAREFTLLAADGSTVAVEVSLAVIYGNKSSIEGYLSIFRDISVRKKNEAERNELQSELLELVFSKLSTREIELLRHLASGLRWPDDKRLVGKKMNVLPGTLDQFVSRIKKKMNLNDINRITEITSKSFGW